MNLKCRTIYFIKPQEWTLHDIKPQQFKNAIAKKAFSEHRKNFDFWQKLHPERRLYT